MTRSNILASAATSASYNMVLQLVFRLLTFMLNAFTLRYISKEMLGVVNVRLTLLYSTVLFIAREAFRRACLSKSSDRCWPQIINLLWCTVPIGGIFSIVFGYIWIYVVEPPDPNVISNYKLGVICYALSTVIEILAEPLWVVGQTMLFVRLKVIVEGLAIAGRCLLTVMLVVWFPSIGIGAFCIAQLAYTTVYSVSYYAYFVYYVHYQRKKENDFPFQSLWDFLPKKLNNQSFISWSLASLTWSFFKQSFLKQILTEGEKYVMTFFGVLNLGEQGIYDVINNLGSLAARLIFLPIEDSGYLFFSHIITRGHPIMEQKRESVELASQVLESLLKVVSLIGTIILVFGYPYSYLFLDLYGGHLLSSGSGPLLLKWYTVYVLVIAINGCTECFVFASMAKEEVDRYNHKMLLFSLIFLLSSYYLTGVFGSVGLILANCLNMLARIIHSIYYITHYYNDTKYRPLNGLLPSPAVIVAFITSFTITYFSEKTLCCDKGLLLRLSHLCIGIICGLSTLAVIYFSETKLLRFVKQQYQERHREKME